MEKIWFVQVEGRQEGPYTVQDLKADHRLTPDSLVWKEGFPTWTPIRNVSELKEVFEDERLPPVTPEEQKKPEKNGKIPGKPTKEEIAIDLRREPPVIIWIIIALLALVYIFYKIYLHESS